MKQQNLVRWLKFMVILAAVCGVILCVVVVPLMGKSLVTIYPASSWCYIPWLVFIWVLSVPCFISLFLAWKIFSNIESDNSFCMENAKHLKKIAYLAAADTIVLVVGNLIFLVIGASHPSILLLSLFVGLVGIAISVASAALSHLVQKAAILQEQSDFTI